MNLTEWLFLIHSKLFKQYFKQYVVLVIAVLFISVDVGYFITIPQLRPQYFQLPAPTVSSFLTVWVTNSLLAVFWIYFQYMPHLPFLKRNAVTGYILYATVMVGITLPQYIASLGFVSVAILLLPHGVIEIPVMLYSMAIGRTMYGYYHTDTSSVECVGADWKSCRLRLYQRNNPRTMIAMVQHGVIPSLVAVVVLVVSAYIEVAVTPIIYKVVTMR